MSAAVYTKWGWITPEAHHRLKTAHDAAVVAGSPSFEIDGHAYIVSFTKHLLDYLDMEGSKPTPGTGTEPIFRPAEGSA